MDLGLNGKRAIVTGGSRGIGKQCSLALAREGVHVCIAARTQDTLNQALTEINQTGHKGHAVAGDLTTQANCEKVVQATIDRFGGVDILVNNVGAARNADILELSPDLIDDALALKTYSYLRMSQLVIPYMKENRWGTNYQYRGFSGHKSDPRKHTYRCCQYYYSEHNTCTFGCGFGGWYLGKHRLSGVDQYRSRAYPARRDKSRARRTRC